MENLSPLLPDLFKDKVAEAFFKILIENYKLPFKKTIDEPLKLVDHGGKLISCPTEEFASFISAFSSMLLLRHNAIKINREKSVDESELIDTFNIMKEHNLHAHYSKKDLYPDHRMD